MVTLHAFVLSRFRGHSGKPRCAESVFNGTEYYTPKVRVNAPRVPCSEIWFDFKVGRLKLTEFVELVRYSG